MFNKGFRFEVVGASLIGEIITDVYNAHGYENKNMYTVSFYELDGRHFYTTEVFEETIEMHLKNGTYMEVGKQ